MNIDRLVGIAKKIASKSAYKYKLGAVALDGNKITALGYNKLKTHPRVSGYIHAECDAVMRAEKCDTIVVVRVSKSGNLKCSKPCDECMAFLKTNNVQRVYYIDWDGSTKELEL